MLLNFTSHTGWETCRGQPLTTVQPGRHTGVNRVTQAGRAWRATFALPHMQTSAALLLLTDAHVGCTLGAAVQQQGDSSVTEQVWLLCLAWSKCFCAHGLVLKLGSAQLAQCMAAQAACSARLPLRGMIALVSGVRQQHAGQVHIGKVMYYVLCGKAMHAR